MLGRDLDRIRKQLELLDDLVYDSSPEAISRHRHKREMEDVRIACELTKKQAAK